MNFSSYHDKEESETLAVKWLNFLTLVEKAINSLIPPLKGK